MNHCHLDQLLRMKNYEDLINEANNYRAKIYYNLTELQEKTGLCIRALKYRMKEVKQKYQNIPMLLHKKRHAWCIHESIIYEFDPKYKIKNRTLYNYDWATTATWNPKYKYDVKYHVQLVTEVKNRLKEHVISYAVEIDERGVNHTHLLTDADAYKLNEAIKGTLAKYYADPKEWQVKIEPVLNKYSWVDYLKKAPLASGTL